MMQPPAGAGAVHAGAPNPDWSAPAKADPVAGVILIVAGLLGIGQLLVSWTSIVFSVNLPSDGGLTGWQVFRTAQSGASLSSSSAIAAYSVIGVGIVGGALILLGTACFLRRRHRPLGIASLALSLLAVSGALCWVVQAQSLTNRSLGQVFAHAGPGWYLFLLAGPLGVLGSAKALLTGQAP